jgi:RND superfamily putative drug exporter
MDYEVFLLTRIRERYLAGDGNVTAVGRGLAASARTITAAALIMVSVFASFTIAGATSLRELGAGLAVAVLLDATIVRLVIVPATMYLLGDWNWWFPGLPVRYRGAPALSPGVPLSAGGAAWGREGEEPANG